MRALLRANRAFRALWTARAVSFLGDALGLVALLLYTAKSTGEALAVAALLLVGDVAPALLGPLTGTVGDRSDLKRVMVACELVQGAAVVLIALTLPPLPILLVLVAIRSVAAQVFQPASRAALPELVDDEDLEPANAALGVGTNGLEVLGPVLAAALLPLVDIRGVLLVDAATFLVSAAVLASLPAMPPASTTTETPTSFVADARAGLGHLWSVPLVRVVGLGFFAVAAANGVDDVALVFLARDSLNAQDSAVALLYAGVGAGLILGYALLPRVSTRTSNLALLLLGFGISSAGNLLTGLAWAVGAAFLLQTVRGAGLAALDVAVNTLLQRTVPRALLARTFGNLYGAVGVAAGLSYVLGGLLLELTDPRTTFVVAGAAGLAATVATAAALSGPAGRPSRPRSPG